MAVLLEETDIKLDFSDLARRIPLVRPINDKRPAGVHQSGILAYVARKIKILGPDESDEEEYPLIWALGQAWEEFVFSLYPEIVYQPGSMCKNEIWRSIDGRSVQPIGVITRKARVGVTKTVNKVPVIEEGKFTFKSLIVGDDFLKDKRTWMWMHQGRGYAGCHGVRHVRWHVMYCRGNYRDFGPIYRRYLVEFTEKEIEQTEQMLVGHRDKVAAEVVRA